MTALNWFASIDLYCERVGPEFWAEPFNAFSNLAFVFAGWIGFYLYRLLKVKSKPSSWLLILSVAATTVGVGSFLFHTFATQWAMIADASPIAIFMILYLVYSINELLRLPPKINIVLIPIFLGSMVGIGVFFPKFLNGSAAYFPAWMALAIVGHFLKFKSWEKAKLVLVAMGLFGLALVFRTIDPLVCDEFSLGTHFLWHSLIGCVQANLIYLCYIQQSEDI